MSKFMYGPDGSKYVKERHIPRESDSNGNVFFKQNGNFYYNTNNATYRMIKTGDDNWHGRLRTMKSSYNVQLQRKRFRK